MATAATGACAHLPWAHDRHVAPVRPASNGGTDDDIDRLLAPALALASSEDAVVRVAGPGSTCSGALIALDLVLTAHHCVAASGPRGSEPQIVSASAVRVELGGDYLPWGNVGVRAILAPPCGRSGGRGDVAVLVLERKLVGLTPLVVHEAGPQSGELVYTEGFGRCALSVQGIRRRERNGGPIAQVSSGVFEAPASVCPGDSGGPALDRATGEIVGIVSLSAMDYDETTLGRSVFARVDAMPKLIAYARLVADGADPADMPPLSCE